MVARGGTVATFIGFDVHDVRAVSGISGKVAVTFRSFFPGSFGRISMKRRKSSCRTTRNWMRLPSMRTKCPVHSLFCESRNSNCHGGLAIQSCFRSLEAEAPLSDLLTGVASKDLTQCIQY